MSELVDMIIDAAILCAAAAAILFAFNLWG